MQNLALENKLNKNNGLTENQARNQAWKIFQKIFACQMDE